MRGSLGRGLEPSDQSIPFPPDTKLLFDYKWRYRCLPLNCYGFYILISLSFITHSSAAFLLVNYMCNIPQCNKFNSTETLHTSLIIILPTSNTHHSLAVYTEGRLRAWYYSMGDNNLT